MQRFNRTQFIAYGVLSAVNAIALAVYCLGLATHGTGSAANSQPVLFVLMGLCLLGALYSCIQRGHDLGWPGWQVFLAFWVALSGGPLLLILIGYLAWAKGETRENTFGSPPAKSGVAVWLWAIVAMAMPWLLFAIATLAA